MSVLKIKNSGNQWVEIPTINGKSAYAYAVDGGYTGTEAQFATALATAADIPSIVQAVIAELDEAEGVSY